MSKPAFLQGRGGRGRGTAPRDAWGNAPKPAGAAARGRGGGGTSRGDRGTVPAAQATPHQRFHEAAAKHQASIAQHVNNNAAAVATTGGGGGDDDYSTSDSDSDMEYDVIMAAITKQFQTTGDNGVEGVLGRTEAYIKNSMTSKANQCLVCIETVRREQEVWNCGHCYTMIHLDCVRMWIEDGVKQYTVLSDEHFPNKQRRWACPKCRHEYSNTKMDYQCYCLKKLNPSPDPWVVPHSCGATCNKVLAKLNTGDTATDCDHRCLLLCHPGPCAPCPKTVRQNCYCEKGGSQLRRCSHKYWSCGQVCNRKLSCGQHRCVSVCHKGDCTPCTKTSVQTCDCGTESESRPCDGELKWKCHKTCGQPLSCGHHKCKQICHPRGLCAACPLSGERTCPCGKSNFSLKCTEDTPTCKQSCDLLLTCGKHRCMERCHQGDCATCYQMLRKRCRCGQKSREQICSKAFLCDTRCQNIKNCGIHVCRRKCCDGNCPPCEVTCSKQLSCKNHKCQSPCHVGKCFPCCEVVRLSCRCQLTSIEVACGSARNTKPPKCKHRCKTAPDCDHTSREPHNCHFKRCPPCGQICDRSLTACSHRCPARCHDAVLKKISDTGVKAGPWDHRRPTQVVRVRESCPPCNASVPSTCLGEHEKFEIECYRSKVDSCHRVCNQPLECGNHSCQMECHTVKAFPTGKQSESCDICERDCERERPSGCVHKCLQRCHLDADGPHGCSPCSQMLRMRCHCNLITMYLECCKWTQANSKDKKKLQSCAGQCPKRLRCGHKCVSVCHQGACSPTANKCTEKTTVKCQCRRKAKLCFTCNQPPADLVINNDDGSRALRCDDQCKVYVEDLSKEKIKIEEEKKNEKEREDREEFDEYQRKNTRKKKTKVVEVEKSSTFNKQILIVLTISVVIVSWSAYYIISL